VIYGIITLAQNVFLLSNR